MGPDAGPQPRLRSSGRRADPRPRDGRLRAADRRTPHAGAAHGHPGDLRFTGLARPPAIALADAPEHQPGGAGVRPPPLLAWPDLAGDELALLVVADAGRRDRTRRTPAPGIPRPTLRRRF